MLRYLGIFHILFICLPRFSSLHQEMALLVHSLTCQLVRCPFLLTLSFSLSTFSFFSHVFKCLIAKDSNIAGFTICADWGKASRSYEISIVFTYAASIVCTSRFRGCW